MNACAVFTLSSHSLTRHTNWSTNGGKHEQWAHLAAEMFSKKIPRSRISKWIAAQTWIRSENIPNRNYIPLPTAVVADELCVFRMFALGFNRIFSSALMKYFICSKFASQNARPKPSCAQRHTKLCCSKKEKKNRNEMVTRIANAFGLHDTCCASPFSRLLFACIFAIHSRFFFLFLSFAFASLSACVCVFECAWRWSCPWNWRADIYELLVHQLKVVQTTLPNVKTSEPRVSNRSYSIQFNYYAKIVRFIFFFGFCNFRRTFRMCRWLLNEKK